MHNRSFAAADIYAIVRLYSLWQRVGSSILPVNVIGFGASLGVLIHPSKKQKDLEKEDLSDINAEYIWHRDGIPSKAKMRAETLNLQGFKFPIVFVVSSDTPSDDDIENFY